MSKKPAPIALSESLGRGVFSSKYADRANRSGVPKRVFLEHAGVTEISVDRLDHMSEETASEVARVVAEKRRSTFYGWAVLVAESACRSDRRVKASPNAENPCHADIILPALAGEDYAEQVWHAQELADASRWRDRPRSTTNTKA